MNQRKIGVIFSYLTMGSNALINIIYVPLLLHFLTKEQYGIYQLMGSMIAYLSIMDFGLANTTTRYLARAKAENDAVSHKNIISSSLTIYLIIAAVLLLLGTVGYFFIGPIYGHTLSPYELSVAKKIFIVMLANMAMVIPGNIFVAVINANERFVFLRGFNLLKVLLQPIIVFCVLSFKADVLNLVLVQTAFTIAVILLNFLYCKLKLKVVFSLRFTEKVLIRELTRFSFFIFLHSLMDQIYWRSGQLILGAVSGAAAVASYAIAMQISMFSTSMPITMSGVFLPQLSALAKEKNNIAEMSLIFCKLGRLQFVVICLLLMGFALLGRTFIILWIGRGYEVCYWITLIIMAGYVLDVTQNVGIAILQALNKHAFRAYVYVAMAVLNISLAIPLGKIYGGIGCAVSTALCLFIGSGIAINLYYAKIGLDLKMFFSGLGRLLMPVLLSFSAGAAIQYFWPLQTQWLSFIMHGSIFTLIYCFAVYFLGFNEYEKGLILNPLKNIFHIVRTLYSALCMR